jgi:hypothetical protein
MSISFSVVIVWCFGNRDRGSRDSNTNFHSFNKYLSNPNNVLSIPPVSGHTDLNMVEKTLLSYGLYATQRRWQTQDK